MLLLRVTARQATTVQQTRSTLCPCFVNCCHDQFIVRSASNLSIVHRVHSAHTSVSMFTINTDNCLLLFLFLVSPSLQPRRHIHHRPTSGLPCPISGLHIYNRSIIDFVSLHLVVECRIHGPVEHQSCKLNNIAVLKQRLASFQYMCAIIAENNTSCLVEFSARVFYQCQVNSRLVTILTRQVFF